MRQLLAYLIVILAVAGLEFACTQPAHAQATNNAIKMGYNFVTVSQNVVFNSAMQAGGTLTFTANAMDGGGRAPGDPFTMKLVFYNASNQVITTVQQANTLVYGNGAPQNYSVTATNCGGSCASVAYVSVQFYGKDGGYWAGNYGPYIINPSLSFNGGSNILYNPEFGVYGTNGYAQGWTSSNGWQSCALYSGAQTCVVNNGAPVNGGTYSATGGSTSGSAGGYTAPPPTPTYTSSITATQQSQATTVTNRLAARTNSTPNEIYINQVGTGNTVNITQTGPGNLIDGATYNSSTDARNYTTAAPITGGSNQITVRQGDPVSRTGKNIVDLAVNGSGNILNLNQGVDANSNYTGLDQGGHYQYMYVNGTNNLITTEQQNTSTNAGHYASLALTGDLNTVGITQTGNAQKQLFATITGNSNTMTTSQTGTSAHYLDVKMSGPGNSVTVDQNNTGASGVNAATINLVNAGGASSVNLTQTGGQTYSISQTCVTAGGCGTITVKQGN